MICCRSTVFSFLFFQSLFDLYYVTYFIGFVLEGGAPPPKHVVILGIFWEINQILSVFRAFLLKHMISWKFDQKQKIAKAFTKSCWWAKNCLETNFGSLLRNCRKQNFDFFHFIAQNSRFWAKMVIFGHFLGRFVPIKSPKSKQIKIPLTKSL